MARGLLTFVALIAVNLSMAQREIPIGTWRTHLNYRSATGVAEAAGKVYCATAKGLFTFDQQERTITKITRNDGLSGVQTGALGYHEERNLLVLTYRDGNIDLITDEEITGFSVLKNSPLMGNKGIRHISFRSDLAFLSSELGMIVMNLEKVEVSEAYTNLGPEGMALSINGSAILRDSLFLATEEGLISASLNDQVNRLDYRNWKRFLLPGADPTPSVSAIASFDQKLYTSTTSGFYSYSQSTFEKIDLPLNEEVNWLQISNDKLVITMETKVIAIDRAGDFEIIEDPIIKSPAMAILDGNGQSWIADRSVGLISDFSGSFESYFPDGPFSNRVFSLGLIDNSILAVSGGYDNNKFPFQSEEGFYHFKDGIWTNYNSSGDPGSLSIPDARDLVDVASPSAGIAFFASFGWGVIQWDESGFQLIDENTPGSPLINKDPPGRFTQITSLAADRNGNLWLANYGVEQSVHRMSASGEWQSYSLVNDPGRFPLELLVMPNDDIWILPSSDRGGGILVFNPTSEVERMISSTSGNGGLPSNRVNDLEVDKEGQIWVGTDNGVGFFASPLLVFDEDRLDAILPIFDSQFLLRGQKVNAIKVDGGNRKWMGTNNGVWLFEESGEEVVSHFTQENSPLLSDRILDIEINPKSGEVYFATDNGIVSFRGTSSEGSDQHQQVKIFPNPVTPDFAGTVGISGLASGAVVKITDVSGKLVKEILAEGGMATWDALDITGNKVASGVYIVFSSTMDGKDTYIGKIAVIN